MRKDVLLNSDLDLLVKDGDFMVGESDSQHAKLILMLNRGDLTQSPLLGVGIFGYLKGSLNGVFRREIQLQFASDGYGLQKFDIVNNEIQLNFN